MSKSSGSANALVPNTLTASLNDENTNIKTAAARLAEEARQMGRRPQPARRDITAEFNHASSSLAPGKLVKDEFFTLFEAVGALEIMDSKMDTGYIPPDDTGDDEFDFELPLSAGQVVWIMDELICQEISWLDGYPLSQTLFTSLHIDRITDPSNLYHLSFSGPQDVARSHMATVLHAFTCALIKCCSMALDLIRSQHFCEEEDFVTHLFGRELLPTKSTDELLSRVNAALDLLPSIDLPKEQSEAIRVRLLFRKYYMQSIFGQLNCWHEMKDMLTGSLNDSHRLGTPVEHAFTDKVQRRLATSIPPRPKLEIPWADACQKWVKLCDDVFEATQIITMWSRPSPPGLQTMMQAFTARQVSTLPRAILQDIVFIDGKIADDVLHIDLLVCDVRDLVLPGDILLDPASFAVELTSDPRHKASRVLEAFLDGVLDEYMNTYRMLCFNRCRMRRALTQLIPIFETLEIHAADYDAELEQITPTKRLDTVLGDKQLLNPLQTWLRHYKLRIMADTISMGFETDIYLADELGRMYWYLSTVLGHQRDVLAHVRIFADARRTALKGSNGNAFHLLDECSSALVWQETIDAHISATKHMATALWQIHVLLLKQGLVNAPPRTSASPELLYEARMKPFLLVKDPAPPSARDFANACDISSPVDAILATISSEAQAARADLASLKKASPHVLRCVGSETFCKGQIKQFETTCVAISVFVTQFKGAIDAKGQHTESAAQALKDSHVVTIPQPEKRYHSWWIVPQLKAKNQRA